MICHYADLNPEYASLKFAKAMKLDIYNITDMQNKVIQNKSERPHKEKNYRLTFNE